MIDRDNLVSVTKVAITYYVSLLENRFRREINKNMTDLQFKKICDEIRDEFFALCGIKKEEKK